MGVTFGPGMVRALEERLAEVTAERDRLARLIGGCVWVDPARQAGRPCVGGTRIPVDMVARYVADGMLDELRSGWPELTDRQILVACWFDALFNHADGWLDWALDAEKALWEHDGELPSFPPIAATREATP